MWVYELEINNYNQLSQYQINNLVELAVSVSFVFPLWGLQGLGLISKFYFFSLHSELWI